MSETSVLRPRQPKNLVFVMTPVCHLIVVSCTPVKREKGINKNSLNFYYCSLKYDSFKTHGYFLTSLLHHLTCGMVCVAYNIYRLI